MLMMTVLDFGLMGGKKSCSQTDSVCRWQHWSDFGRDKGRINAPIGCFLVCHRECFRIINLPCLPIKTKRSAKLSSYARRPQRFKFA
jgi:hypothetical protein